MLDKESPEVNFKLANSGVKCFVIIQRGSNLLKEKEEEVDEIKIIKIKQFVSLQHRR